MNKFKNLSIILLISLSFMTNLSIAQINGIPNSEEIYCKNNDFQFRLEGKYYYETGRLFGRVYVCPKSLPVMVTVVRAANQTPENGNFVWTVNGVQKNETSNTLTISNDDFDSDMSILEVEFWDIQTGKLIKLALRVFKNIELRFEEGDMIYQFDDNKIEVYIGDVGYGEDVGTPWNFIESNKFDMLRGVSSRGKGHYAINNILSNHNELNISPNKLTTTPENIAFSFQGSGRNIIEVYGCHESKPELLLFTESAKSFEMQLFRVCESDDDEQFIPAGTLVSSPDEVCIDGGLDGSIDLMWKPGFIPPDPMNNNEPKDRLVYNMILNKYQILAKDDKCDTEANPKDDPVCPDEFNEMEFVIEANNILGKVALSGNTIPIKTIYVNYDVIEDDGILDNEMEQTHFDFKRRIMDNALAGGIVAVHFIKDLGEEESNLGTTKLLGKAIPDLGRNLIIIDSKDADGAVLAHEIGHARFSLQHPGCPCKANKNGEFGLDDFENFMQGYNRSANKIRRYQFEKLHKN